MHQKIIRKLDTSKGGERLNRAPDFPARGFLVCGDCGGLMTAGWSKGKKQRYPYYSCKNQGCFSKRKSVPRQTIHDGIEHMLEELVPSSEALAVFEAFVSAAIHRVSANAVQDRDDLKLQISALSDQHRRLLDRIVEEDDAEVSVALKLRLKELQLDLKVKQAQHAKLSSATQVTPEIFEHSKALLANPSNLWKNGSLATKKTVLRACFATPPGYTRTRGFRTPKTTPIFNALDAASEGEINLVEPRTTIPHSGIFRPVPRNL
ncbi:zinc ribbon domain-containing protein [Paracoccus sp. KR1-242]|uniref:zinc ribbon domain-containing protein n=1 Tax=Paracoccus sp. KR1-242 TaxID=3410028 RepID=UPI003C2CD88D